MATLHSLHPRSKVQLCANSWLWQMRVYPQRMSKRNLSVYTHIKYPLPLKKYVTVVFWAEMTTQILLDTHKKPD